MDDLLPRTRAVLETTSARWLQLTEIVPGDLLNRPPAPGEWSAVECLRHLLDTERWVFPVHVRAFLSGQDLAGFDPDKQGSADAGLTPAELAAALARQRAENVALLEQVTDADLVRTAQHSKLGTVTLGERLHAWAAHDLNHTIQAERALMQPFIAGCGPWRSFFSDHDAGA